MTNLFPKVKQHNKFNICSAEPICNAIHTSAMLLHSIHEEVSAAVESVYKMPVMVMSQGKGGKKGILCKSIVLV